MKFGKPDKNQAFRICIITLSVYQIITLMKSRHRNG